MGGAEMTGLRIVLAADEAIGPRVANLVLRSSHELVAVAAPSNGEESSLAALASSHEIGCLDARKLNGRELISNIAAIEPDVFLNIHSLTKVSPDVLNLFPTGAWNLHPGALPEAAGANVPSWAITLRWASHGVTLHKMTADFDAGDISYEDRFPIGPAATGLTLSAECSLRGLRLIQSLITQLENDPSAVPSLAQDLLRRRYFGRQQPSAGIVDWNRTAADIEAYVRACDFRPFPSPWRPPHALVGDHWHELHSVEVGHMTNEPPGTVRVGPVDAVAAADRWISLTETTEAKPARQHLELPDTTRGDLVEAKADR